jgi:hypothetical protein
MDKLNTKYGKFDQNLMDRFDALDTALKYQALTKAGICIGSASKKTFKIANTVNFVFNGIVAAKTTAAVPLTATDHDITNSATLVKEAVYLISFSAVAGTPVVTMGTVATGSGNAVCPATPATSVPVAMVRIAVAAGATPFDATSDDLDAGHLTCTYTDLGWCGSRFDSAASF